jgi:hypothetical protein
LYVQLKDDKVKQSFKPNTWTPMLLNGQDAINPTKEGNCFWEAQLHLTLPKTGRPTYVKINFSRDYKGKNDTTGTNTYAVPADVTSVQFTLFGSLKQNLVHLSLVWFTTTANQALFQRLDSSKE